MVFVPFFTSCGEDDLEDSKFRKMTVERNEFDNWLLANYVQPYNIDLKYLLYHFLYKWLTQKLLVLMLKNICFCHYFL